VRSVSREEVWASAGVQGAWVGGCGCEARAEMGRYCAAQWHLTRAVGKRFRGCSAKRLYVHFSLPRRGYLATEPTSHPPRTSPEKLTPNVDVSVRPPRRGVNTASDIRRLGVDQVVVLDVRVKSQVATRARRAWRRRRALQANELAAPVQDEVAPDKNGRMTAENAKASSGDLSS